MVQKIPSHSRSGGQDENLDKTTGVVKRESEVLATKLKSKRRHVFEFSQR